MVWECRKGQERNRYFRSMQSVGFYLLGRESKLDRLGGAGGRRLELRGWSASMHEALGLSPSTIWRMPVILVLGRWKFKAILR